MGQEPGRPHCVDGLFRRTSHAQLREESPLGQREELRAERKPGWLECSGGGSEWYEIVRERGRSQTTYKIGFYANYRREHNQRVLSRVLT